MVYPPIHWVSGKGKREKRKKKKERSENWCSQIWRLSTNLLGDICQWLCKNGHFQTSFASPTYNTEYYSTIICMHIIVYVYKDFASLEKIKMCCRLNKKQNGHLPGGRCHVAVKKAVTHLNTSALTPVILDIKLWHLCNLYPYWAFKYLSF